MASALGRVLCEAPKTGEMIKEAITAPDRVNRDAILEVMREAQNLETLDAFHKLAVTSEQVVQA